MHTREDNIQIILKKQATVLGNMHTREDNIKIDFQEIGYSIGRHAHKRIYY
jgi:hypothetical protein